MRSVKKKSMIMARAILYGTGILIILLVGAFLSLQTRPVRDVIKGLIVKTIEQNTRSACRIESLNGNLISRFEIKGIELKDSMTGVPLMAAGRIEASYSIPMLLAKVLWINRLAIDGVSVNLLQAKDGTWNFELPASENPPENIPETLPDKPMVSKSSSGYKVEIRRLLVSGSDITLSQQTASDQDVWHLTGINGQARLRVGKDISAKIKQLAVCLDSPYMIIKDLTGEIRYDSDAHRMDFTNTRIIGEKSDFSVNGRLHFRSMARI